MHYRLFERPKGVSFGPTFQISIRVVNPIASSHVAAQSLLKISQSVQLEKPKVDNEAELKAVYEKKQAEEAERKKAL